MIIKDHTRIDLAQGGTRFKQGDFVELAFTPRDAAGKVVDLTGKDIEVSIWNRSKGVIYQGAASFDSAEKLIRVTIKETLDHGKFQIEFTVTDSTDADYRRKFPSDEYNGVINITPSTDNMDVVGVQMMTVDKFRAEFDQAINALPVDSEINLARVATDGTVYPNLPARLTAEQQATATQLAEKATSDYVDSKVQEVAGGAPKGSYLTITELTTALPQGDTGNYLVAENMDGSVNGYIHTWNGSAWVSTGVLYQAAGIAQNSVKPFTTSFLASDNLYIYDKRSPNNTLVTDGSLYPVTTHDVSEFIPVSQGLPYSLTRGMRFIYLYDADKQPVEMIESTSHQSLVYTFTAPINGFIRISIFKAESPTFTVVQSTQPAGIGQSIKFKLPLLEAIDNAALLDGVVDYTKASFVSVGKNLFNKNAITPNTLLNSSTGVLSSISGYATSEFIKVKKGVAYTLNKVRVYTFYGLDKKISYGINTGNNAAKVTIIPQHDSFIRVSISSANLDSFQIEIGEVETSYDTYKLTMPNLKVSPEQLPTVPGSEAGAVSIVKSGETFTLSSVLEEDKPITIKTTRNGSANGAFNFAETTIEGNNIHPINDDITPIRTFYTLGANHGYGVVEVTRSGFATADLGSIWTDGTRQFTLVSVNGNVIQFAPEYTITNGMATAAYATPVADLTHVSGATNQTTVPITGHSIKQLYPSIQKKSVKYFMDGEEISTDGAFSGEEVLIKETYEIIDYKSLIDFYQANIGQTHTSATLEGIVKISNSFTYTKGLKCLTSHSVEALKTVSLGRCGFLQSIALSLSGHTRKRFMPNVKIKSGFDFAAGVDLDAYATSLVFAQADYTSAEVPPSHYVDWLYQNGQKRYGFTMGYLVDKTNSKNSDRVSNSPNGWDMRSTKKSYPIAIEGVNLQVGQRLNFMGFRNYLTPAETSGLLNASTVEDKKGVYVYINSEAAATGVNKSLDEHIGKQVTVLQGSGVTIANDIVDGEGATFSTTANSHGILKIS